MTWVSCHRNVRRSGAAGLLVAASLLLGGCYGTSWHARERLPRDVRTVLVVRSSEPARVFVEGREVGPTPARIPLVYQSVSQRYTRNVTLWKARPKLATALTMLTGGGYLPSSLFPVASEAKWEPVGFSGNEFRLRLETAGLDWIGTVELLGVAEQGVYVDLDTGEVIGEGS